VTSTLIILVNAFTYGFCDSSKLYFVPKLKLMHNIIYFFLGFLMIVVQMPFKFYLTKEFLFVLYDELKNYGLSTKLDYLL